jgi:hypothetical protein
VKTENLSRKKQGKRQCLNYQKTRDLKKRLNIFFESNVELLRIKFGKKQTLEMLHARVFLERGLEREM